MLAVVHAVVREKENGASCMAVWDAFHVLIWVRTFVSGLRTKKPRKPIKKTYKT